MNKEKAKFILSAYRPNHQDRTDPEFSEALEMVRDDDELKAWFEDQLKFDGEVIRAFDEVSIPRELRDVIVLGSNASAEGGGSSRRFFGGWRIQALAAVLMIGLLAGLAFFTPRAESGDWQLATISALSDLKHGKASLDLVSADPAAIRSWLKQVQPALEGGVPLTDDEVEAKGCKQVNLDDGLVTIVCFERDGRMFHLASYRVKEEEVGGLPGVEEPDVKQLDEWVAAVWGDGNFAHMLITAGDGVKPDTLINAVKTISA